MQKQKSFAGTLLTSEESTALGRIGGKTTESDSLTNFHSAELQADFQINLRSKAAGALCFLFLYLIKPVVQVHLCDRLFKKMVCFICIIC